MISGKLTGTTLEPMVDRARWIVNVEPTHASDETQMKRIHASAAIILGLSLFGNILVRPAFADPSPADRSVATQLFEEGRALLRQGSVAAACPKLEESERIDPGGGTLLNVALCHEQLGRKATAWVEFTEALGVAKKEDRPLRVEFARAHLAQLEPTLSRIVVQVPRGGDVPDFEVRRDGSVVASAAWGSPVPVDPGDHLIEASAPGKIAWRQTIQVGLAAETKTVVVPVLDNAPLAVSGTPATQAVPAAVTQAPSPSEPREAPAASSGIPPAAWIALGVGVAATGVATYLGLHAMALKSDADSDCPGDRCSAQGASQNSDAIHSANLATAGFAVGAVGIGLATVLFVMHAIPGVKSSTAHTAPGRKVPSTASVSAGVGLGELTIAGRW
jgi:hypothetical protein